MSAAPATTAPSAPILHRPSVDQHEAISAAEILTERDQVELINGLLVT